MKYQSNIGDSEIEVSFDQESGSFTSGKTEGAFEFVKDNGRYFLRIGTKLLKIDNVQNDGSEIEFSMDGIWHKVSVKDEQELLLDKLGFKTGNAVAEGSLKAPMPGKILEILVKEGENVTKDQPLIILEAMKMENELKSSVDGVVLKIEVETGQSLEKNTLILEIETLG